MANSAPKWVESQEGKMVFLHTRGPDGSRIRRGMRLIEKTVFGWAAISDDKSNVIDLQLASDPLFWLVEEIPEETPAEIIKRYEDAIAREQHA